METTYKLRPNVTWHDGEPFTAEDFVFGWRVYSTSSLGHSGLSPYNAIEDVQALDPLTFVIRWRQPYADTSFIAGLNVEFPALPRHILERHLMPDQIEAFANHPFWTREYVGLGPFKLDRWESGAFLEGAAFDGHIWGRPKIGRIKLSFISDANTAMANVLSGDMLLTDGTSVGLPEVAILKRQWAPQNGNYVLHPNQWRAANFQMRPDYVAQRGLQDPRVRKALAHAVDKSILNETLYDGDGILADSVVPPMSLWGPAAERGAAKYPYDLRRSEQLMAEAGFTRGADGQFGSADGRFSFEVKTNAAADNEAEVAVLSSSWRQSGFDAQEAVLPSALAQNPEARATYVGVFTNSQNLGESALLGFATSAIPRAENRWAGGNRGGWSNAEYDRALDAFTSTLGRGEREQQLSQLVRIHTDDLPSISLFFRAQPWVHANALRGPKLVPPEGNMSWNIQEWELR
jgi:peptide/nickel transport system substrate-binding protein